MHACLPAANPKLKGNAGASLGASWRCGMGDAMADSEALVAAAVRAAVNAGAPRRTLAAAAAAVAGAVLSRQPPPPPLGAAWHSADDDAAPLPRRRRGGAIAVGFSRDVGRRWRFCADAGPARRAALGDLAPVELRGPAVAVCMPEASRMGGRFSVGARWPCR